MDGDGILDLVTAGYTSAGANPKQGQASVLLGEGDGSFGAKATVAAESGTGNSKSVALSLGDINGDGVLDLVTAGDAINGGSSQGQASVLAALTKDGVSALLPFSLKTLADARQALPDFKEKLDQLSAQRGQIGAMQARLSVAVNTLQVSIENYASAESRIKDADVAEEAAWLVKNQILQQAGAAILAQANQAPRLALMLLRT